MEWEKIYKEKTFRHKNTWPDNLIVQSISKNYSKIKNKKEIKILEIGSGWGNNLRFLKENKFDYYGIEQSKTAYLHCKKKGYKKVFNENFINLDNFQNNYFDCIIDRQSLQHNNFQDILEIVDNLYLKIKKKGLFISHLISRANYDVNTTFFTQKKILKVFRKFKKNKIELHTRKIFDNNKNDIFHEFYNVEFEKQ